jgi:hypothetical protein
MTPRAPRHAAAARPRTHQRGAVLVLYAFTLVVILGFVGLVLDLGLVYFRKVQLQGAADAIALAAAQRLNGTADGVTAAVTAAATNAATHRVGLGDSLPWDAGAALRFNSSPDASGGWVSAGDAAGTAAGIWYARVDIGRRGQPDRRGRRRGGRAGGAEGHAAGHLRAEDPAGHAAG